MQPVDIFFDVFLALSEHGDKDKLHDHGKSWKMENPSVSVEFIQDISDGYAVCERLRTRNQTMTTRSLKRKETKG